EGHGHGEQAGHGVGDVVDPGALAGDVHGRAEDVDEEQHHDDREAELPGEGRRLAQEVRELLADDGAVVVERPFDPRAERLLGLRGERRHWSASFVVVPMSSRNASSRVGRRRPMSAMARCFSWTAVAAAVRAATGSSTGAETAETAWSVVVSPEESGATMPAIAGRSIGSAATISSLSAPMRRLR